MIYTHSKRPNVNFSHAHAQTSTLGHLPFAPIVSISLTHGHQFLLHLALDRLLGRFDRSKRWPDALSPSSLPLNYLPQGSACVCSW